MNIKYLIPILALATFFVACDDEPDPEPQVSTVIQLKPNVGGETQPNVVYIDFSKNRATAIQRDGWDLALNCGVENRALLNSTVGMLARPTSKTDFDAVDATDTIGMGDQLDLDAVFNALLGPMPPPWVSDATTWADDPAGDLTKSVIAEVVNDTTLCPVYIINRGSQPDKTKRGWKKVQVSLDGASYKIKIADIDGSNQKTFVISKDTDFNFAFINFDGGELSVEPAKNDWDISFTTNTQILNAGVLVPYFFKDLVNQNRDGVKSAEVVLAAGEDQLAKFENFGMADIAPLNFSSDISNIGANWRTIATPGGGTTGVKTDRFYVIQDKNGSYFKLIFSKMLDSSGTRGFPEIGFEKL